MIKDFYLFLLCNLHHYARALWGLRLRFDPNYPFVTKFFPSLISEPVFEYRTYGLHALWAVFLAWIMPDYWPWLLIALWGLESFERSGYLETNLIFWRQVLKENGPACHRATGRYMEQLLREIERRMKAGENAQGLTQEAFRLQDEVIRRHGRGEASRRILAGG